MLTVFSIDNLAFKFNDEGKIRIKSLIKSFYLALEIRLKDKLFKGEVVRLKEKTKMLTIGRREEVNFPDLGLFDINAKIDTGAYTSSLHCYDIREKSGELHFRLVEPSQTEFEVPDQVFTDYSETNVKNSFGEIEKRFVIFTKVEIGGKSLKSYFSLTNRGTMKFPVLIGRRLLNKRFIVDVSLANNLLTDDEEG